VLILLVGLHAPRSKYSCTNVGMSDKLIAAAIELLESGNDEGCDGLVVVSADTYTSLQRVVQAMTGIQYGATVEQ
jgi:hypothetical protein